MRKRFFYLALLIVSVVHAETFVVNGIRYNVISSVEPLSAEVTTPSYSTSYSGDIVIPQTVDNGAKTYTVTAIGNGSFKYSNYLNSILLPSSLIRIGTEAFYGSSLKSVIIPNGVQEVGDYAFNECYLLADIQYPSKFTLGKQAFGSTKWLTSQPQGPVYINDYFYAYSGKMPSGTILTIKDGIKEVCYNSLSGQEGLKGINLPASLKRISTYAFFKCLQLTDISIPDSVTFIGNDAFVGCWNLKNVKLPAVLETLEMMAFKDCSALLSIDLPSSLKTIGNSVFEECNALTTVKLGEGIKTFGQYAFRGCEKLNSVQLPSTLETIPEYAFFECSSLPAITIPTQVKAIGTGAFASCNKLTSVNIPRASCIIGSSLFSYCTSLTSVHLPDSLQMVPDGLFYNCRNLPSVVFPSTVISLGNALFTECTSLTSVKLPDMLTRLGSSLFEGCTALATVNTPSKLEVIEGSVFRNCSSLKGFVLPESLTSIGDYAFEACVKLSYETLPASLKTIGSGAFKGCTSLTKFKIPASVTSIPMHLFDDCTNLTSVELHSGVKTIGYQSFGDCHVLSSITFPETMSDIGAYAFQKCYALKKIKLPSGLPSINDYLFYNCTALTDVEVPMSVELIRDNSFQGCSALVNVNIPRNIRYIGNNTFYGCSKLTSITLPFALLPSNYSNSYNLGDRFLVNTTTLASIRCEATLPPVVRSESFYSVKKTIPVYVPQASIQLYKTANYWKDFTNIIGYTNIFELDSVSYRIDFTRDNGSVVDLHNGRKKGAVVIPDSVSNNGKKYCVRSVANNAFKDSTALTSIELPSTLEYIGASAFQNCKALGFVTCRATVPPATKLDVFTNIRPGALLLVPATKVDSYAAANTWKSFTTIAEMGSVVDLNGIRYIVGYQGTPQSAKVVISNPVITDTVEILATVTFKGKVYPVDRIGAYAFHGQKLRTIKLTDNIRAVDDCAFKDCIQLDSIYLGAGIEEIGKESFNNCKSIKLIQLPKSLKSIGYASFRSCTSLPFIKLPASISNLGENAFYGCTSLRNIHSYITDPTKVTMGNSVFGYTPFNVARLNVPVGSKELYMQAAQWKLFGTIIEGYYSQLTISPPVVITNKMVDGKVSAIITKLGTLQGTEASDIGNINVTASATYDNASVGINKTITIVYTLTGSAMDKYLAPKNDIIYNAKISDYVTLNTLTQPVAACEGDVLDLNYSIKTGTPTHYKIMFDTNAINAGLQHISYTSLPTLDNSGSLAIPIAYNIISGTYSGTLKMKNELNSESLDYPFTFTINVAANKIVTKFEDIILFNNSDKRYIAFQWLMNGVEIPGATKQFFQSPIGLIGMYSVKLTTADGKTVYTCPKVLSIFSAKAQVRATPNPVKTNELCKIEFSGYTDEQLKNANLSVYTMQGVCIYKSNVVQNTTELQLSVHGVYIGKVTGAGDDYVFKIMVTK